MVAFPVETTNRQTEILAQIVWRNPLASTRRKIYGMHCKRPTEGGR